MMPAAPAAAPRRRKDHEGPVHAAVLERLRFELPGALVHHSPNEGGAAGKSRGARARALGTLPGWPDIEVLLPGGVTLFFEVKAPAGPGRSAGKESLDQQQLRQAAQAMGHRWAVVWSQDDAVAALDAWGIARRVREATPQAIQPSPSAPEADQQLIATGGRYAALADYAAQRGMTLKTAQARWHQVRGAVEADRARAAEALD